MSLPSPTPPSRSIAGAFEWAWRSRDNAALVAVLVALVGVSAVFLVAPGIDLWFTQQFYSPSLGFPARSIRALHWFRGLNDKVVATVVIVLLVALAAKLAWPHRRSFIPARVSLFLISSLIIGPGLVVNAIFKNNWGRARPEAITDFGGRGHFTGAWRMADQCVSNCSFMSGEASSAIWLTAVALVAPAELRRPVLLVTAVFAVLVSLNRIAFGGHFLSDVLIAWTVTLAIILLLYRLIYLSPPAMLQEEALERRLTSAGEGLRRGTTALAGRLRALLTRK